MRAEGRARASDAACTIVHYVVAEQRQVIYLVFVYTKDELASLSPTQKKMLKERVRVLMSEG
jgi:hypothetical protein